MIYKTISSVEEFQAIEGNFCYKLLCDLDFSNVDNFTSIYFAPIVLDGQGHTIKNLTLSNSIFIVGEDSEVKNINFENINLIREDEASRMSLICNYATKIVYRNVNIRKSKIDLRINDESFSNLELTLGGLTTAAKKSFVIERSSIEIDFKVSSSSIRLLVVGGILGRTLYPDHSLTFTQTESSFKGVLDASLDNSGSLFIGFGGSVGSAHTLSTLTFKNSYSNMKHITSIQAKDTFYKGGFIGLTRRLGNINFTNCYVNLESSSNLDEYANPFVGQNDTLQENVHWSKCFWNKDLYPSSSLVSDELVGKTSTELMDPNTFLEAGWSKNIWLLRNGHYPEILLHLNTNIKRMRGRLTKISHRDVKGGLITAIYNRYDEKGRIEKIGLKKDDTSEEIKTVGYSYNNFGDPVLINYPKNPSNDYIKSVKYDYDYLGRKNRVADTGGRVYATNYIYNQEGQLIERKLNNQKVKETREYDFQGRLMNKEYSNIARDEKYFSEKLSYEAPYRIGYITATEFEGTMYNGGRRLESSYDYDYLGRITESRTSKALEDGLESYTPIETPEEFQKIEDDPGGNYKIVRDIDMSDFNFKTIRDKFTGILDGQGYTIKNLYILNDKQNTLEHTGGIFLEISGTVKTLKLKNIRVTGKHMVAPIGATLTGNGKLLDIHIKDLELQAGKSYAGIVGQSEDSSLIKRCQVDNLTHTDIIQDHSCGGVVSAIEGDSRVEDCKFSGKMTAGERGLIAGRISGNNPIKNCLGILTGGDARGLWRVIDGPSSPSNNSFYDSTLLPGTKNGVGKPTVELQTSKTYLDSGWDSFDWKLKDGEYPNLKVIDSITAYRYDENGNIQSVTCDENEKNYTYEEGNNRLKMMGERPIHLYDKFGAITSMDMEDGTSITFTRDSLTGRVLSAVRDEEGEGVRLEYDGLGKRISKQRIASRYLKPVDTEGYVTSDSSTTDSSAPYIIRDNNSKYKIGDNDTKYEVIHIYSNNYMVRNRATNKYWKVKGNEIFDIGEGTGDIFQGISNGKGSYTIEYSNKKLVYTRSGKLILEDINSDSESSKLILKDLKLVLDDTEATVKNIKLDSKSSEMEVNTLESTLKDVELALNDIEEEKFTDFYVKEVSKLKLGAGTTDFNFKYGSSMKYKIFIQNNSDNIIRDIRVRDTIGKINKEGVGIFTSIAFIATGAENVRGDISLDGEELIIDIPKKTTAEITVSGTVKSEGGDLTLVEGEAYKNEVLIFDRGLGSVLCNFTVGDLHDLELTINPIEIKFWYRDKIEYVISVKNNSITPATNIKVRDAIGKLNLKNIKVFSSIISSVTGAENVRNDISLDEEELIVDIPGKTTAEITILGTVKSENIDFALAEEGVFQNEISISTNSNYELGLETLHLTSVIDYILISNLKELEGISDNPDGVYKLVNSIDMTSFNTISDEFKGILNGDCKSLINLKVPLFKKINGATIENIMFQDVDIAHSIGDKYEYKGNNFGSISAESVGDIFINNIKLTGRMEVSLYDIYNNAYYSIGGLIGFSSEGEVKLNKIMLDMQIKCFCHDISVYTNGVSVGGLIGYAYSSGTTITECGIEQNILTGTYGNTRAQYAVYYIAGMLGRAYRPPHISNSYVKGNIEEEIHNAGNIRHLYMAGAVTKIDIDEPLYINDCFFNTELINENYHDNNPQLGTIAQYIDPDKVSSVWWNVTKKPGRADKNDSYRVGACDDSEIVDANNYKDWDKDTWIIEDGKLPQLKHFSK